METNSLPTFLSQIWLDVLVSEAQRLCDAAPEAERMITYKIIERYRDAPDLPTIPIGQQAGYILYLDRGKVKTTAGVEPTDEADFTIECFWEDILKIAALPVGPEYDRLVRWCFENKRLTSSGDFLSVPSFLLPIHDIMASYDF